MDFSFQPPIHPQISKEFGVLRPTIKATYRVSRENLASCFGFGPLLDQPGGAGWSPVTKKYSPKEGYFLYTRDFPPQYLRRFTVLGDFFRKLLFFLYKTFAMIVMVLVGCDKRAQAITVVFSLKFLELLTSEKILRCRCDKCLSRSCHDGFGKLKGRAAGRLFFFLLLFLLLLHLYVVLYIYFSACCSELCKICTVLFLQLGW